MERFSEFLDKFPITFYNTLSSDTNCLHFSEFTISKSFAFLFAIFTKNFGIELEFVFYHLYHLHSIPQSLILSRAYPFEIIWTETIFNQYIVQGKDDHLIEYCVRMEFTDTMIEQLMKSFQAQSNVTPKMEMAISRIVESSRCVILRYRLASLLSDKRIVSNLINEDCLYFLKDSSYGRHELW